MFGRMEWLTLLFHLWRAPLPQSTLHNLLAPSCAVPVVYCTLNVPLGSCFLCRSWMWKEKPFYLNALGSVKSLFFFTTGMSSQHPTVPCRGHGFCLYQWCPQGWLPGRFCLAPEWQLSLPCQAYNQVQSNIDPKRVTCGTCCCNCIKLITT